MSPSHQSQHAVPSRRHAAPRRSTRFGKCGPSGTSRLTLVRSKKPEGPTDDCQNPEEEQAAPGGLASCFLLLASASCFLLLASCFLLLASVPPTSPSPRPCSRARSVARRGLVDRHDGVHVAHPGLRAPSRYVVSRIGASKSGVRRRPCRCRAARGSRRGRPRRRRPDQVDHPVARHGRQRPRRGRRERVDGRHARRRRRRALEGHVPMAVTVRTT